MPLYELNCTKCGNKWETIVPVSKASDDYSEECPKCKSKTRRKDFYNTGYPNLVGPGFYHSDYTQKLK